MEIKLDAEAAQEIVKKAILEQMGPEARDALITQALKYLLTEPPKDRYATYHTPSPLQVAFNDAAAVAARKIVMDEVAGDESFKAKVREKVGEAMSLIDEANYSNYVADALGEALKRGRSS